MVIVEVLTFLGTLFAIFPYLFLIISLAYYRVLLTVHT